MPYFSRPKSTITHSDDYTLLLIKFSSQIMAFYDSRLAYELDLSRRISLERELQYSRALEIQRIAEAKELEFREIKEVQRITEEQEFRTYQLRKNVELQEAEQNLARERLLRAQKDREYQVFVEAERRSRLVREEELEVQKSVLQTEQKKRSEALAASRRVEFEKQIQLKEQQERENSYVLEQQRNQEKLQKELREIDLQIGTLYDTRDQRKRLELLQLQKLDEQIFKLRQQLRGSKVRQLALEQQLLQLSKLIV